MMHRSLKICSFALALTACATTLTGCGGGGGGEAKFDPTGIAPQTAEEKQKELDYEAELKKQHEKEYGN
jgi:hypothetical protein